MATYGIEVLTMSPEMGGLDLSDPYRYGWRYVCRHQADGSVVHEQVPLTLEDVLHPQEGDCVVQNDAHARRCAYLYDVFRARLAADPTAVVLHDTLVDWGVADIRPHAPDLAILLGVRERQDWGTFDVGAEQARPALVVEVTSPSTATLDRITKVGQYYDVQLPLYVIVDTVPGGRRRGTLLVGYERTEEGYRVLPPDARGRLWLEPVRCWLGIADGEPVLYDETDRPLGDYTALTAALAEAEQQIAQAEARAGAEAQARSDAEARLRALEDELRRLRGGAG